MNIKAEKPTTVTLTLELSAQEAALLHSICRNITGKFEGPRGITNQISDALNDLGVSSYDINGRFDFPDTWEELTTEKL